MSEKKASAGVDTELVRELAKVLAEQGLTEIEVEHGEMRLRLARPLTPAAPAQMHYAPAPVATAGPAAAAEVKPTAKDLRTDPRVVLSPMVGTAYMSPEPGSAVFVKVGDTVTEGQTLLIIEAMKTFNPIAAPRAGKIVQLIVSDAQPVEFGEALLLLE